MINGGRGTLSVIVNATPASTMMRLILYDIPANAEPVLFDNVSLLIRFPSQGAVIAIE